MTLTLTRVIDYGPGFGLKAAHAAALASLDQAIAWYLKEGIEGQTFASATVLNKTWNRPEPALADGSLHSIRLDAEVAFA